MPLPSDCHFDITRNPCHERELHRDIDAIIRALENLCRAIEGDPDVDPPVPPLLDSILPRFRLTEALEQGGSADAVLLTWDGAAWVEDAAIEVTDVQTGGMWQGEIGYEGWARQGELESTHYAIVWMHRIAYLVRGVLVGSLSGGSTTLAISSYSDGVDPGAEVEVFDPEGLWDDSVAGGAAIAIYNFEQSRYEVIYAQQSEWVATAVAQQDFTPANATVSITIAAFKTPEGYTPDPSTPTFADNTFGLSGSNGDLLHIQRSKASGNWEILVPDARSNGVGTSIPLNRFRLTSNLQIGGSADAVLLDFPGYGAGETIRVFDRPYPATPLDPGGTRGMWSGKAFMEGWARKREGQEFSLGPPEYEIVWMEQYGRFIFGTLTEDMGATDANEASATIDYMFGQGDAYTDAEQITVHDDMELFPFALEGAKFFAVRNEYLDTDHPETPYYQVVVCQQMAIYGRAQLGEDMCSTDAEVSITQFQPWSPSIYNQDLPEGEPAEALNTFKLAGMGSDFVYIVGDFHDPEDVKWHIVQVEHKESTLITFLEFDQTTKCIRYKKREKCAIMSCEPEGDIQNLICGEVCQDAES